jgi:transcriptional regulator with XRE-family HTH domain
MSQEALAEKTGLQPSYIARVEDGFEDPTWGDMRRIAEALDVTLEALSELAEQYEIDREV